MKLAIALLALVACVLAYPEHHVDNHYNKKQQDVYEVLKYIHNPIYHKEHAQIAENYSLESNAQHYKNDAYKHFVHFHHDRFLKKGEIFSIFDHEHVKQAKALFELFYYADSYETFHHTALWARHHLNEGLFIYSYCVAIAHREDTHDVVLPPIHEIYPHFFFNSEVIHKAYKLKMSHYEGQGHHHEEPHHQEEYHHDHEGYTIHSNYSGYYLNLDPEQSLSYYLEDVGINGFYFYFNLYYPYWMDSAEYGLAHHKRGELFYYLHKQLYARYHLERYSHGVGEVEYFNWDLPFKTGYYSSLVYPNGLAFPERPHFANLKEYLHYYGHRICDSSKYGYGYTYAQTFEQRIREAIDSGFVLDHEGNKHQLYTEEGMNILGNIIQGNADSPNHRYYGSYVNMARHVLGYAKRPLSYHKLAPSALEHYSTSLRDPAFYQIFKKVLLLVEQYKQNLPSYHHEHLAHEDIKVQNVEVEPLVTFYDHHYSDITNGLYVTPEEYETDSFRVKVHQYRLNHKGFNYKVHVNSKKDIPAVVKVFIGPKYDEHGRSLQFSQIRHSLVSVDQFVYELKSGENVIKRNSSDSHVYSHDHTSYYDAYRYIMENKHSHESQHGINEHPYGFPLRFQVPRGSEAGITFQLYVIVYPYVPQHHEEHHEEHVKHFASIVHFDQYPMGYPFDRPVEHEDVYYVPNAYVKHVNVYHKVHHEGQQHEEYEHQYVDHKNYHDDHVVQNGDHNNYRLNHYQHHEVSHDDVHQDHEIYHDKSVKSHQNVESSYKRFVPVHSQKMYVPHSYDQEYQHYYGEHQVPEKYHEGSQYHDVDNQKYHDKSYKTSGVHYKRSYGSVDAQKKHEVGEGVYEHHEPQEYAHKYVQYHYGGYQVPQVHDVEDKHYGKGVHYDGQVYGSHQEHEGYVPYQWVKQGEHKAHQGLEYPSVEEKHHYEPHHGPHHYSSEEQD